MGLNWISHTAFTYPVIVDDNWGYVRRSIKYIRQRQAPVSSGLIYDMHFCQCTSDIMANYPVINSNA